MGLSAIDFAGSFWNVSRWRFQLPIFLLKYTPEGGQVVIGAEAEATAAGVKGRGKNGFAMADLVPPPQQG